MSTEPLTPADFTLNKLSREFEEYTKSVCDLDLLQLNVSGFASRNNTIVIQMFRCIDCTTSDNEIVLLEEKWLTNKFKTYYPTSKFCVSKLQFFRGTLIYLNAIIHEFCFEPIRENQ